jgi:wyosine [tRNA(Phe)-imidazoG37] synthetase (radical SAM superfamily)
MAEAYYRSPVEGHPRPQQPANPRQGKELSFDDHSRDAAGLVYVYPVVSRRSGGVSVGINLNPNNACNWACAYCQVEGLVRGAAPQIDLELLTRELDGFLGLAMTGAWMEANAPAGARRITDIALSGNGEPTTCGQFPEVIERVIEARERAGLQVPIVLITNGSRVHLDPVQRGLRAMAGAGGQVWFKLDRATAAGREAVNRIEGGAGRATEQLALAAGCCPTRVQTCMYTVDGVPPAEAELQAYLALLQREVEAGTTLDGVTLYGLARPSMQPGAERLGRVTPEWLEALAERVREATALPVAVHP